MELPSAFKERMKNMLGEEYKAFLNKTDLCLRQIPWVRHREEKPAISQRA